MILYKDGERVTSGGASSAKYLPYVGSSSGLTANTVQGAIDENASAIAILNGDSTTEGSIAKLKSDLQSSFQDGVNKIATAINTKTGAVEGDDNYLDTTSSPDDVAGVVNTSMVVGGADIEYIAPEYDSEETYNTNDVVIYEEYAYKCLDDGVTGEWDESLWEITYLCQKSTTESSGGTINLIAPEFSDSDSYTKGDRVIRAGLLYELTEDYFEGEWDASKWDVVKLLDYCAKKTNYIAPPYDETQTYNTGDVIYYQEALYQCIADDVTGEFNRAKWADGYLCNIGNVGKTDVSDAISDAYTFSDAKTLYVIGNTCILSLSGNPGWNDQTIQLLTDSKYYPKSDTTFVVQGNNYGSYNCILKTDGTLVVPSTTYSGWFGILNIGYEIK